MQKACSFVLACVFVLSGCTGGKNGDVRGIIVTPSVLDFGRVRVGDIPTGRGMTSLIKCRSVTRSCFTNVGVVYFSR